MKRITAIIIALMAAVATSSYAQTLNVKVGNVTYAHAAASVGDMVFNADGTLTIEGKNYQVDTQSSATTGVVESITLDESTVEDNTVSVAYSGTTASVTVAGNIARHLTVTVSGAHVSIIQGSDVAEEITYALSGTSADGEFYMEGSYKATVELRGLALTNPSGAAIDIENGKRIALSIKNNTTNTLTDGSGGSQKGCLRCRGHLELKGKGELNIYGNTAHGISSKEYVEMKNCTVNILSAVKDGLNCNQYFLMESGTLTVKGVGDDGLQVSYEGDGTDEEDTGTFTIQDGTIDITVSGDAAKGIKADNAVNIAGGAITITQKGNLVVEGDDMSYPTSVKAGGDVNITGGTVTIKNTAQGGKGISTDGNVSIDESNGTVVVDIEANGAGGTAETAGSEGDDTTVKASYKVYVSLPASGGWGGPGGPGGSSAWNSVYLYKSDGTLVQKLTSTTTRTSGATMLTFYYYDFKEADTGVYYFRSDNFTDRGTSYTILSNTFSPPTSGEDVYYSITNSYSTSGTTRTYSMSNVTNTYGGSSDVSEDDGTGYNAAGIKADGNVTIAAGTITIANSGSMSKSVKSKGTVTVDGGVITLAPSGDMQVINSDASYSSGIKAETFVQNGGTLKITATGAASRGVSSNSITTNGGSLTVTNSGAGQSGTSDTYTAKGLKADSSIALNAGTITITMSGTGGKGIKSSGTYTQGLPDGTGPTLTVSTSGSSLGGSSQGGGGGGWGGGPGGPGGGPGGPGGPEGGNGSSAKAVKVLGTMVLYGGESTINTKTDGAEGFESKTSIDIRGGHHYLACYDDCINSSGAIYFNGGVTVCYSNGNDAVDSNYGRTGAITIGDGVVLAYSSRGAPEEGIDCDNNAYIQITGSGIAISAGANQGGGSNTISNASQGYYFHTGSISYAAGRYYTLADSSGKNLVTYNIPVSMSSSLSLFTAKGMTKGSTYSLKYSTTAPTNATTAFHGVYLGSSATGTTNVISSFTAR